MKKMATTVCAVKSDEIHPIGASDQNNWGRKRVRDLNGRIFVNKGQNSHRMMKLMNQYE